MNKDKRLRDLREKKESRNTDLCKNKEKQKDKLELLLREKSMKKELNQKGWKERRNLKNTESIKRGSRLKEMLKLKQ